MIHIILDQNEMTQGATVGLGRALRSGEIGAVDKFGAEGDKERGVPTWNKDIEGALAELATAKALGMYWPGSIDGNKTTVDIPPDIEVRLCFKHSYGLRVRPGDYDYRKYVLVTGLGGFYRVHGWMFGHEAKQYPTIDPDDRGPFHVGPQDKLRPLEEIGLRDAVDLIT